MSKILFVAVFSPDSTNFSQARELEELGHKVHRYEYRQIEKELGSYKRDFDLVGRCNTLKPDLAIFSKCNGMQVFVIHECNKVATTCLWYMDPPGNWNFELEQKIKAANYVCCAKQFAVDKALKLNKNSYLVIEGFDNKVDKPIEGLEQTIDISFIGRLYGDRERFCKAAGAQVIEAYGEKHAEIVNLSKINLNICTDNTVSDRAYKIMGASGFLLTNDWDERKSQRFVDKQHLVIFKDKKDLKAKVKYYLENELERKTIAKAGYEWVQHYNRTEWAKQIMRYYHENKLQ